VVDLLDEKVFRKNWKTTFSRRSLLVQVLKEKGFEFSEIPVSTFNSGNGSRVRHRQSAAHL